MGFYIYESDDGNNYVVVLRIDKGTTGNFNSPSLPFVANFPRQYRMRYILGIDPETGSVHKQQVASATDYLFTTATSYIYNDTYYAVSARIAEKRPVRM
jgi:hypothetical protein